MSRITLTLPDGSNRHYKSGITPNQVASDIAPSLGKKAISAWVNETHWDLQWPITENSTIAINTMKDDKPALELIRHDLAHIMARAVQTIWPSVKVTIGPIIKDGWYYDFDRAEPFTPEDLDVIEKKMREIINLRDLVKTEIWTRDHAIKHYEDNGESYKVELIEAIPGDEPLRMYWHGDWQDLCRGPHLQHTGMVPADGFKLMSIAGAYWRGNSDNKMLQRIYGVAFANKENLKKHLLFLEEAQKRDHRKLGKEMSLFHMQEEAPGMIFWHPNGWTIYRKLQEYMQRKLDRSSYLEVKTPQVVDRKLWEASGHWDKYQENMFIVEVDEDGAREKRTNALKPMNCPCHVQIYNQGLKSYRDLPLRMAEFGSCHRYEPSGAMHGIMRVRGFVQDDAHIFCTESQIESETKEFISLLSQVYRDLGFEKFHIKFSDRPEKRSGDDSVWDKAESALLQATEAANCQYELNPGEGAFYGPKLEFVLTDAIGREWQCGTLQVDFVLPERLDAHYVNENGAKQRPVLLHRAILGSFERFIGILLEENSGKMPLWLAPQQVAIASIITDANEYIDEICKKLFKEDIRIVSDKRNEKIGYKIREHSLAKVPIILAVGEQEVTNQTVAIRRLGDKKTEIMPLEDFIKLIKKEAQPPDLSQ
ncbi:MAG: threonine--tRNA ligase [Paracoccaceae bacterium]|nr:threonine--tRNA ligase [Paracoccaceae bacterium]